MIKYLIALGAAAALVVGAASATLPRDDATTLVARLVGPAGTGVAYYDEIPDFNNLIVQTLTVKVAGLSPGEYLPVVADNVRIGFMIVGKDGNSRSVFKDASAKMPVLHEGSLIRVGTLTGKFVIGG